MEGFIVARYWMFIQVYFHKYHWLFDFYLSSFTKESSCWNVKKQLEEYLNTIDSMERSKGIEFERYFAAISKKAPLTPRQDEIIYEVLNALGVMFAEQLEILATTSLFTNSKNFF